MRGINKVILIGNATRDAELRHTGSGKAVTSIRLATNRTVRGQEETQFHIVIRWEGLAETVHAYVKRSDPLYIVAADVQFLWCPDRLPGHAATRSELQALAFVTMFLPISDTALTRVGYARFVCRTPNGNDRSQTTGKVELGQIVATPSSLSVIEEAGQIPPEFVLRHKHGDWGDLDPEDHKANEYALTHDQRLLSAYHTCLEEKLWIITEWDRSVTTLLLPEEY